MEKQTTLIHFAIALNLSTSLVSRAWHGASDVKPATMKPLKTLADQIDYQPNQLAQSLLHRKTNSIGVIITNLDHLPATMEKDFDDLALDAGYTVMVAQGFDSDDKEIVNTNHLLESS